MQKHNHEGHVATSEHFPTDTAGLVEAVGSEVIDLADGDEVELRIAPVTKRIGDSTVRMLAYNGSIPGPTLRVREGSELEVNVANEADLEATVHWHGLRLDNRYDGTHETQAPIPVGGTFTYRIEFPDPGVYWYHPHIREDYGQEMGLYGNILVVPAESDYWPPAHREVLLTLDDVLIEDGKIAPFGREETTYAAMGRFGNVMLVGGETELSLTVQLGEVVRFYLTNTANTRVFNVAIPDARIKLVGGDSGRYEREEFVDSVILAPSERIVIDVVFEEPGQLTLEHRTPERTYSLAKIEVDAEDAAPSLAAEFDSLRHNPEWVAERERLASYFDAPPDKTLALVAEMDMGAPEGPVVYACPMHPDVVSDEQGRCPKCGMKLLATAVSGYVCPMHPDVVSDKADHCPKCGMKLLPASLVAQTSGHGGHSHHGHGDHEGHEQSEHAAEHAHHGHAEADESGQNGQSPDRHGEAQGSHGEGHKHGHHAELADEHAQHDDKHAQHGHGHGEEQHGEAGGIEWEDDMVDVNRITTPANMHWSFIDRATGAANHAIDWSFRVGDQVKLRLVNEMDSDHPMHHPFHIHGAGRFVVLARDGVAEKNLVWKDTVLVRTGETVDILLDVTNPGIWMAHCHIAEHHESGMMFSFNVAPAGHSS
jgi:FtsP/CotA-like multicopper oxidase with cupredoxin domain